jgi:hypothetical protein
MSKVTNNRPLQVPDAIGRDESRDFDLLMKQAATNKASPAKATDQGGRMRRPATEVSPVHNGFFKPPMSPLGGMNQFGGMSPYGVSPMMNPGLMNNNFMGGAMGPVAPFVYNREFGLLNRAAEADVNVGGLSKKAQARKQFGIVMDILKFKFSMKHPLLQFAKIAWTSLFGSNKTRTPAAGRATGAGRSPSTLAGAPTRSAPTAR